MKPNILNVLCCPRCEGTLEVESGEASGGAGGEIISGELVCANCGRRFTVSHGIPRFVGDENYAASFGLQWNRFRLTQLDSETGLPITRDRFLDETGWSESSLRDRRVLDVGCGAGRFAEVALSMGVEVFAVDYSNAVDACWENLSKSPRLHVMQADVYALPFRQAQFDFVYSLGVLQHTPDPGEAILALIPPLKPGGGLTVDFYPRRLSALLHPRYALRPITRRMDPRRLFGLVESCAPALLGVSRALSRIPLLGRPLRRLIPVANYEGVYPLSEKQLSDWAILDTYDWLAARYDNPQTPERLESWLRKAGLTSVEVFLSHHLVGRGRKVSRTAG